MDTPLISVVMPAYNAEKTIARAIESVLGQTYNNIELLVINDGSIDNTLAICKSYSDERMTIISQENRGLAQTRNVGIEKAKGSLLVFIDSDDWYEKTFVEKLYKSQKEYDAQLAVCGMIFHHNNGQLKSELFDGSYENFWENDAFLKIFESGMMNSACNKIYDLSIIRNNQLSFESLALMEDIKFNIHYLQYIKQVAFVPECLYNYDNTVSVLTAKVSTDMFDNYIHLHAFLFSLISINNSQIISKFVYHQYMALCLKYINSALSKTIDYNRAIKTIDRYIRHPLVKHSLSCCQPIAFTEQLYVLFLRFRQYRLLYILLGMLHKIGK